MKRQTIAVLAAGLALLLGAAGGALAQTEPEVPWWVIAGGGSEGGGSGGAVIVNDTLGQPVSGPSTGGGGGGVSISLDAGYRQQLFGPAAAADLQASVISGSVGRNLQLDWSDVTLDAAGHAIAGVTYNVYRAQDAPYFAPGPASATGLTGATWTDPDTTVLTSAAHSTYYVVVAVYNGLKAAPSNRVGAFVFALVPGG